MKKQPLFTAVIFLAMTFFGSSALEAQYAMVSLKYNPAMEIFNPYEVDVKPEFVGGTKALFEFLSQELVYPELARENGVEGNVQIVFTIEANGTVSDPMVVHGPGFGCDEEVLRVFQAMPRWKAGTKNQMKVATRMAVAVKFRLDP